MRLKVLLPTEILIDQAVTKVNAEAPNGAFCLLPRHVDFVAALVPGLLAFVGAENEREEFLAVDVGILVKQGEQVTVATRHAVLGADLGMLRQTVAAQFHRLDEREKLTRAAVTKLEVDFVRRFIDLEKHRYG